MKSLDDLGIHVGPCCTNTPVVQYGDKPVQAGSSTHIVSVKIVCPLCGMMAYDSFEISRYIIRSTNNELLVRTLHDVVRAWNCYKLGKQFADILMNGNHEITVMWTASLSGIIKKREFWNSPGVEITPDRFMYNIVWDGQGMWANRNNDAFPLTTTTCKAFVSNNKPSVYDSLSKSKIENNPQVKMNMISAIYEDLMENIDLAYEGYMITPS